MIEVVAALIRNERGHVLVVRKRGTSAFMQPGGKREPGENDIDALTRELREEIGCRIVPGSASALGIFEAPAAHEPGRIVRAAIYSARISGAIECRAEIDAWNWVDPELPGTANLAALTRDRVLPLAAALNRSAQT